MALRKTLLFLQQLHGGLGEEKKSCLDNRNVAGIVERLLDEVRSGVLPSSILISVDFFPLNINKSRIPLLFSNEATNCASTREY